MHVRYAIFLYIYIYILQLYGNQNNREIFTNYYPKISAVYYINTFLIKKYNQCTGHQLPIYFPYNYNNE